MRLKLDGRSFTFDFQIFKQQPDQVTLANFAIAQCLVRRGCVIVGEEHDIPRMGPEPMQQRREVGIARQDHELVEMRVMCDEVANIHDHTDIGRILELRRQRWAIDDLEPAPQKMVPHERKGAHVG